MEVKDIEINKIDTKDNIRTNIERTGLTQLMEDIKQHGLLHAIGVKTNGERYIILYGHRRLEACKKLGWTTISSIIYERNLTPEEFISINVSENIHRLNNSPAEFARVCKLLKSMGLNESEIAVRLSVPKLKIETALRIYAKIPKGFEACVRYIPAGAGRDKKGKISASVANAILALRIRNEDYKELFKLARKQEISVAEVSIIGKLVGEGMNIMKAIEQRLEYVPKTVSLVLKRDKLMELENDSDDFKFRDYIKQIVKRQNPKLVY